jgi:hypothetical protein
MAKQSSSIGRLMAALRRMMLGKPRPTKRLGDDRKSVREVGRKRAEAIRPTLSGRLFCVARRAPIVASNIKPHSVVGCLTYRV